MFKSRRLCRPEKKSLFGALLTTILVILGSQISPFVGYILALSTLLIMIVAMYMESIWPTKSRKENPLVFSLFWGLILGTIVPYIISTFLKGGISAIFEIITK